MTTETYYILFDPVKERYFSQGGIGRVHARAAYPFKSVASAEKQRDSWWRNKRFNMVLKVTLTIEHTYEGAASPF